MARLRRKKVSSVDKANVLETSRLWRSVMHRLAEEYTDVEDEDVLVDNCAMQLVRGRCASRRPVPGPRRVRWHPPPPPT